VKFRKRVALCLLLAAVSGFALPRAQAAESLPPALAKAFREADVPLGNVGIFVQEIAAKKPLLAHHAEQPMNPASVMKLVTSYAALELLGPAYTWKTEVYAGPISAGMLSGDLTLKGYGDPELTLEDFWLLLRALRQRGLREIQGDLILDNSFFDLPGNDPNGFDNLGYRAYNTPPQALMVGFKAVAVRFIPEPESGKVRVVADPELPKVNLVSAVDLKEGPCPSDWRVGIRKDVQSNGASATVQVSGAFPADCGEKSLEFNLLSNNLFIGALFQQLWTALGGQWNGKVRDGIAPVGRPLLTWESHSLAEAVRDMNKWSNNIMARQLLLTLGVEAGGAPATRDKGVRAVRNWLAAKSMDFPELSIENGSGLSRQERISAAHLGELLVAAANSPSMPELMASLPIVGADGTMKKRLKNSKILGRAHIKTGTLEGVKAIAGYVLTSSGKRIAVVCLVNHPNAGQTEGVQDTLLEWVYEKH
jgi:serine-type D-Ala-D-Ala carboxypeptidase/endopeptidase (penicillin-binding protein 4)